ncbi:MAG: GNAT family N-acetyltransferase [Coriobacteriia bacterium]
MKVRTLERSDIREGFECGEPSLDAFLQRYAWQDQTRYHLGVTYVAVDERTRRVVGYFTLAAASISSEGVSGAPPSGGYRELPVLRVARLAVDRRVQGAGVGSELLRAALRIAVEESRRIGCAGVMVDARPESVGFYERFGFRAMTVLVGAAAARPRPTPMFLAIARALHA